MARSKHKREKREETTDEFVKRINQHKESGKRNGSKDELVVIIVEEYVLEFSFCVGACP